MSGLSCSMRDLCCVMWDLSVWCESCLVVSRLSCSATCGILVPGSGIESMSPALAGGFLTTRPLG